MRFSGWAFSTRVRCCSHEREGPVTDPDPRILFTARNVITPMPTAILIQARNLRKFVHGGRSDTTRHGQHWLLDLRGRSRKTFLRCALKSDQPDLCRSWLEEYLTVCIASFWGSTLMTLDPTESSHTYQRYSESLYKLIGNRSDLATSQQRSRPPYSKSGHHVYCLCRQLPPRM